MTAKKDETDQNRRIDWEEYSRLCRLLAERIIEVEKPETVVGIAHGGVIVGATVATIMGRDFFPIKFSRRVNARVVRKESKMLVPPTAHLEDKIVLLVDDATRTGETMKSAVEAIRKKKPREIITAVLARTGAYETDYAATYFPGQVIFPWMIEQEEPKKSKSTASKKSAKKSGGKKS